MGHVYGIICKTNGKRYIGKTFRLKERFYAHRYMLRQSERSKDCNRRLFEEVKKYGFDDFEFVILESFENISKEDLIDREFFWMGYYQSTDDRYGYNLRKDSSSRCYVHEDTRRILSERNGGENNPNFNNKWSDEQRAKMSSISKDRHASGHFYGESWRNKISEKSKEVWKDLELKAQMANKVKLLKRTYMFHQYDLGGNFIKTWGSVEEIINAYPDWKWQNIYSVCNGYKPTYRGYVWKKEKLKKE